MHIVDAYPYSLLFLFIYLFFTLQIAVQHIAWKHFINKVIIVIIIIIGYTVLV